MYSILENIYMTISILTFKYITNEIFWYFYVTKVVQLWVGVPQGYNLRPLFFNVS